MLRLMLCWANVSETAVAIRNTSANFGKNKYKCIIFSEITEMAELLRLSRGYPLTDVGEQRSIAGRSFAPACNV